MSEFMNVDGFVVYRTFIGKDWEGQPDLCREVYGEYMEEHQAKKCVEDAEKNPEPDTYGFHYEPGTITI